MEPLSLGECFCALSAPYCDFTVSLAEFAASAAKRIRIIFCRGVYLAENTSQAASVEFVHLWRTNYARSRLQKLAEKPEGFFRQAELPQRGRQGAASLPPAAAPPSGGVGPRLPLYFVCINLPIVKIMFAKGASCWYTCKERVSLILHRDYKEEYA